MKDSILAKNRDTTKKYLYYILVAYSFSIIVRLIWVFMNGDNAHFFWNNQFMINTNDGYYWAEGARDIIANIHKSSLSPVNSLISWITAIFYWVTPFSLDTIIFYMPAVLSSLIVIPIILIGDALGNLHMGFIAALFSSIAWSYYNRTMIGYYDTDMLNIVLPTFLLWSLILAFKTQKDHYLLFMALDIIIYRLWYPQSYSLEFAFFGLILLFTLIYKRKDVYFIKMLTLFLFAMMGLSTPVRAFLVLAFYWLSKKDFYNKYYYHILAIAFLLFFFSGGINPILAQLKSYVFRDTIQTLQEGLNLHYFSVGQTIAEAGHISFEKFINRISGSKEIFFLSIIGFIWLIKEHKILLLSLPLVGLGFLAYGIPNPFIDGKFLIAGAGLRFTIYAIVPLALGISFLIIKVAQIFSKESKDREKIFYFSLLFLATTAILYPNIKHVREYQVDTVMNRFEVQVLTNLKSKSKREDYTIAWWDYGYPIRFYSHTKTLIDGAQHSGAGNFPVSVALTKPQNISAKIARLAVQAREGAFNQEKLSYIQQIFLDNNLSSSNDFFNYLDRTTLKEKKRDIYLYLPFRMVNIYGVVEKFSSFDLLSGVKRQNGVISIYPMNNSGDRFILDSQMYFSKRDGNIYDGEKIIPINKVYKVTEDKKGKVKINSQIVNINAELNVIILPQYGQIIVLDKKTLASTYIQLFFLQQYDKRFYEPVILSPYVKVYKLKI